MTCHHLVSNIIQYKYEFRDITHLKGNP